MTENEGLFPELESQLDLPIFTHLDQTRMLQSTAQAGKNVVKNKKPQGDKQNG